MLSGFLPFYKVIKSLKDKLTLTKPFNSFSLGEHIDWGPFVSSGFFILYQMIYNLHGKATQNASINSYSVYQVVSTKNQFMCSGFIPHPIN